MTKVPVKLRLWWDDLGGEGQDEVKKYLKGLTAKEKGYRAEISKLKQQIEGLKFENNVQVATDLGEKNRLAQENEVLRAQIQQIRIAADNQQRSWSDERLIKGLKMEISECRSELENFENTIAGLEAHWAKRTEERNRYLRQLKRDHEQTIANLKRKVATLEDKATKQARTFEAENRHCYDLLAQMEVEIQQWQNQHLQDYRVLKARNYQIERLLIEKGQTRDKIKTIAHAIIRRCLWCEDMTRTTFFSAVLIYVKRTMYELEQLERDLAPKPAARPNDAPRVPVFNALMYL
ncbi:uncharacterized protein [Nicotiana sylvestris]|uniref:uncharacterized protein n=1 Tax=Nicotiana sylvestris TaxID=4096 RepID=UPI00388C685D